MTPKQAKKTIRQSGLRVSIWAGRTMDSSTDTMQCCPLACKAISLSTRSDTASAASKANMPAPAKAVTTPPSTQTSTDTGVSGPSAIDTMPVTPSAITSSMSQLRITNVAWMVFMSLAIASFSLTFDQTSTTTPNTLASAVITGVALLIALTQLLMAYLIILLTKHFRPLATKSP